MTNDRPPFVIQDRLLGLAVHVQPNQIGLHLHPGSTLTPQRLEAGWHYHWPLLSVLRVFDVDRHTYRIWTHHHRADFGDQPIVAVSQDHHLFTVTGQLKVQINPEITDQQLAKLNRHATRRLIRPLVRQAVRQTAASIPASQFKPNRQLVVQIEQQLSSTFAAHGLLASDWLTTDIQPYRFFQRQQAQDYS